MQTWFSGIPGRRNGFSRVLKGAVAALTALTIAGSAVSAASSTTRPYHKVRSLDCVADICSMGFGKVGKNRRLHIDSVSCWILPMERAELKGAGLYAGKKHRDILVPVKISGTAALEKYALNHKTVFFANAGERVSIRFENQNSLQFEYLECKIAGEIEKLK